MARISQILSVIIATPCAVLSWRAYTPRDVACELPAGTSMITAGFVGVWANFLFAENEFQELLYFFLSYMFFEAASSAILTLLIIFLRGQLCVESITLFFIPSCICLITGSMLSLKAARVLGVKASLLLGIAAMVGLLTLVSLVIYKPSQSGFSPLIGVLGGLFLGWLYPTQRNFVGLLLPEGHEAGCVGLFQSFAVVGAGAPTPTAPHPHHPPTPTNAPHNQLRCLF